MSSSQMMYPLSDVPVWQNMVDVITYIYDVPGEKAISASNKNPTIS
ncbi:MAG: hypothetical protein JNM24_17430 [Bdellovibrionaceae bacterium]|nr:hypothetical protein [Pseudobdellovibrionaceae bacterium]